MPRKFEICHGRRIYVHAFPYDYLYKFKIVITATIHATDHEIFIQIRLEMNILRHVKIEVTCSYESMNDSHYIQPPLNDTTIVTLWNNLTPPSRTMASPSSCIEYDVSAEEWSLTWSPNGQIRHFTELRQMVCFFKRVVVP